MAITVVVGTIISLFVINKRYGPPCQLRNVLLDGLYLLHHVIDILTHPVTLILVFSITIKRQAGVAASSARRPLRGGFSFARQGRTGSYGLTEQRKLLKLTLKNSQFEFFTSVL